MKFREKRTSVIFSIILILASCGLAIVQAQQVSFDARRDFPVGSRPKSVAVGDFDGDGVTDLAVINESSNNVSILLATGAGGVRPAQSYMVGSHPSSVAVGDFDGDGVADLAVANAGSNSVSILLGTGDGGFEPAVSYAVQERPSFVAAADFDGDGVLDLAVANYDSDSVSILMGDGAGGFRTGRALMVGGGPSASVAIVLGNGEAGFTAVPGHLGVGYSPSFVAAGDFDLDGHLDLAVANLNSYSVTILRNTSGKD